MVGGVHSVVAQYTYDALDRRIKDVVGSAVRWTSKLPATPLPIAVVMALKKCRNWLPFASFVSGTRMELVCPPAVTSSLKQLRLSFGVEGRTFS